MFEGHTDSFIDGYNGYGLLAIKDDSQYGFFENSTKIINGMAIIKRPGYFFRGMMKDGQKHGPGELITDKVNYIGYFMNDKFEGQGSCVFKKHGKNSTYKGEFKNGIPNGSGEY